MRKAILAVFGIVLTAGLVYAAWGYVVPNTIRYRVTVEIDTPEGIKSGSVVRELNLYTRYGTERGFFYVEHFGQPFGMFLASTEAGFWMQFRRPLRIEEAVVVDLGERGKVISLLPDHQKRIALYQAFPFSKEPINHEGIDFYKSLKLGEKVELKDSFLKVVTFEDPKDPKSIKLVYLFEEYSNGLKQEDNFEEIFGAGVHLKSMTVEITDESASTGEIDRYMPPLTHDTGYWEWRKKLSYNDPRKITEKDFKRGRI